MNGAQVCGTDINSPSGPTSLAFGLPAVGPLTLRRDRWRPQPEGEAPHG